MRLWGIAEILSVGAQGVEDEFTYTAIYIFIVGSCGGCLSFDQTAEEIFNWRGTGKAEVQCGWKLAWLLIDFLLKYKIWISISFYHHCFTPVSL